MLKDSHVGAAGFVTIRGVATEAMGIAALVGMSPQSAADTLAELQRLPAAGTSALSLTSTSSSSKAPPRSSRPSTCRAPPSRTGSSGVAPRRLLSVHARGNGGPPTPVASPRKLSAWADLVEHPLACTPGFSRRSHARFVHGSFRAALPLGRRHMKSATTSSSRSSRAAWRRFGTNPMARGARSSEVL